MEYITEYGNKWAMYSDLTLSFNVDYKLLPTYSKQTLLFVHVLRIIFKNCAVGLFSKAMAQLYDMVSRQSANVSEENKNILHLGLFLEPMSRHMFFYGSKMCVNCSFHL